MSRISSQVFYTGREGSEEYQESELPALNQLVVMGYEYKNQSELNRERRDYREVLLYDRLEKAIRKLNPELDEDGVYEAIGQIKEDSFPSNLDMMDTNEKIHAKLVGLSRSTGLEPITVIQNFAEGNVFKTICLFDFDNPENNDYLVTNQFQLEGLREPKYLDIVLFVNGIPLVIIECKAPSIRNSVQEAVEKNLYKYQERGYGFEKLMFYNHILIATSGYLARHGAVGTSLNHYGRWSEAEPLSLSDIEKMCNRKKAREQEILIAGMLSKKHLLDLLKNYVIYETVNNKRVKKIAKHQQYRVVTKAVDRLANIDENSVADKGGVVWHTQGSGKSLSMLWLATQLIYKFGNPHIVIVTDRTQLDKQIHETFWACGFPTPIKAKTSSEFERLLQNPKGKTIITTIQKFGTKYGRLIHTDQKVIVLVDEGHRSQYKLQAETMRSAMPNAVFFAFTGTPIDKRDKSTYKVFGPLLDRYTFEESKADGATLPIFYEERIPDLYVQGKEIVGRVQEIIKEKEEDIAKIFQRVFSDLSEKERERLKQEYATKQLIVESKERIRKIAADVIEHFTTHIQPNGFKALLVAPSREAAVTYKRELDKLGAPRSKIIMTSHLGEKGRDGTSWDEYFLTQEQREFESEFFKTPENEIQILVVVDMLLVGYDVPIVQVMYLDHPLREHGLLQAIARVNRPYNPAKTYGLIVDYCGITKELQQALAIFDEQDIKGALLPIEKEVQELKARHTDVISFFSDIPDRDNNDLIIEKFEPAHVREDFEYAFKMFSKSLDAVLPRKEAGPYIDDFKYLSKKRNLLRNFYGSYGMSFRLEGQKVQQLIDDYIDTLRMQNLIDYRKVTNETFLVDILRFKNDKARTALVKNKIRQIIQEKKNENPVYYDKIRERLEKLIEEEERKRRENAKDFNSYKGIYKELLDVGKERTRLGFKTTFEQAVYEILLEITNRDESFSRKITKRIYEDVKPETKIIGWRTKRTSQTRISLIIYDILRDTNNKDFMQREDMIEELTEKIFDLVSENL
ncbi:MAG: type I restriction endonuclease subunit R [Nitrososphaeraceae archaeon]|nr:type I restriction endonuclease subunit R [Nitrososphaeraceae archaeon]